MIYASFANAHQAEQAVGALLDHGVEPSNISLVLNENYRLNDTDHPRTGPEIVETAKTGITVTTPEDAASGAAKGAGVGIGVGALAGLASVLVPGFGLVMGGGALAAAITGMAGTTVAGAIAGGAMGYLKDQGLPDHVVDRYQTTVRDGGAVVGVFLPSLGATDEDDGDRLSPVSIEQILMKYGGSDFSRPGMTGQAVVHTEIGSIRDTVV